MPSQDHRVRIGAHDLYVELMPREALPSEIAEVQQMRMVTSKTTIRLMPCRVARLFSVAKQGLALMAELGV